MKVLLTGGKGFIARNLAEQLGDRFEFSAPGREQLDLLNPDEVCHYLHDNRFDVVIHAATYDAAPSHSTKDPSKVLENNLRMFFSLARCSSLFGRMIFFGSGAEFAREHWMPNMSERYFDCHVPGDQYGFSKYVMTKYALETENIYNLRLFAVFGKYEDWRVRVTSDICRRALFGQPIVIRRNRSYDFLFIDDLVRIVEWFMLNQPSSKAYNVCTGEVVSFRTIAERVVEFSRMPLDIRVLEDENHRVYGGDNTLLANQIPGLRFSAFDDSLRSLYLWYDANRSVFDTCS